MGWGKQGRGGGYRIKKFIEYTGEQSSSECPDWLPVPMEGPRLVRTKIKVWKKLKARKIKKEIKGLEVEDTSEMGKH